MKVPVLDMRCLLLFDSVLHTGSDAACWDGGYESPSSSVWSYGSVNYQRCCYTPSGNPGCFRGDFTFQRCCVYVYGDGPSDGIFHEVPFLPTSQLFGVVGPIRGVLVTLPSELVSPIRLRLHQEDPSALLYQSGYTMARWIADGALGAEPSKVLDVACGAGLTALAAVALGFEVLCTDQHASAIESANRNSLENAELLQGRLRVKSLAWGDHPEEGFSRAICAGCFGVLAHNPDKLLPLLQRTLQRARASELLLGGWVRPRWMRQVPLWVARLGLVQEVLHATDVEAHGFAPPGMQQVLYRLRLHRPELKGGDGSEPWCVILLQAAHTATFPTADLCNAADCGIRALQAANRKLFVEFVEGFVHPRDLGKAEVDCPDIFRGGRLVRLLPMTISELDVQDLSLVEAVVHDWLYDVQLRVLESLQERRLMPFSLLLHSFLATTCALDSPPVPQSSLTTMLWQRLHDSERLEPSWNSSTTDHNHCTLERAALWVARMDALRLQVNSRAFGTLWVSLLTCLRRLVAKHGGIWLLHQQARVGGLLFAWLQRLFLPTTISLSYPYEWDMHVDMQRPWHWLEGNRQMRFPVSHDVETRQTLANLMPFCSQSIKHMLSNAHLLGIRAFLDVGGYLGGCSYWAVAGLAADWVAVTVEPHGPAVRGMQEEASQSFPQRWFVYQGCAGEGALRLQHYKPGSLLDAHVNFFEATNDTPSSLSCQEIGLERRYPWRHPCDYDPVVCHPVPYYAGALQGRFALRIHAHVPALTILRSADVFFAEGQVSDVAVEVHLANVDVVADFLEAHGCYCKTPNPRKPAKSHSAPANAWTYVAAC